MPSSEPSMRAVSVWVALGGRAVEGEVGGERLAGHVVGVLAHRVDQRVVAAQREVDAVLDLQAGALARVLDRVHDLARGALAQQLVVEVELQRDRVVGLALELVALARKHHQREIVGAEALLLRRRRRS